MVQLDAPISQPGDYGIMRHHDDGASLLMQFAKNPQDDFLVLGVEIAGRFIGQHNFGIINQRSCDAHALLFAAR